MGAARGHRSPSLSPWTSAPPQLSVKRFELLRLHTGLVGAPDEHVELGLSRLHGLPNPPWPVARDARNRSPNRHTNGEVRAGAVGGPLRTVCGDVARPPGERLSVPARRRIPKRQAKGSFIGFAAMTALASALAGGCSSSSPSESAERHASTSQAATGFPKYHHVFLVISENHKFEQIIGNPAAPIINALASAYGLATQYTGVSDPSEPNYVAMLGGSDFGISSDDPYFFPGHTVNAANLMSQLEAVGKTWRAYFQDLPFAGYRGYCFSRQVQRDSGQRHRVRRQAQRDREFREHAECGGLREANASRAAVG
jgi:hypothetical protein